MCWGRFESKFKHFQAGMVHICVSGVFCVTSVDVSSVDENEQCSRAGEESHVMVTCLTHDLKTLSSVSLTHDRQQNSHLLLHTVSELDFSWAKFYALLPATYIQI